MGVRAVLMVVCVHALALAEDHDQRRQGRHSADPERLLNGNGEQVVNGCGPEWFGRLKSVRWRLADKHTYLEGGSGRCTELPVDDPSSCDGEQWSYEVDFHDACNLHDAGYEGRFYVQAGHEVVPAQLVYDRILDEDIDYSDKSREWIDNHFLEDLRALCDQQIVKQAGNVPYAERGWAHALEQCKNGARPESAPWGAYTMYAVVRGFGAERFKTLSGQRRNDGYGSKPARGVYRHDDDK